jgi:hypothetical protein
MNIYMYMCVCVCVCVCNKEFFEIFVRSERNEGRKRGHNSSLSMFVGMIIKMCFYIVIIVVASLWMHNCSLFKEVWHFYFLSFLIVHF